jgi:hypothetical protein
MGVKYFDKLFPEIIQSKNGDPDKNMIKNDYNQF